MYMVKISKDKIDNLAEYTEKMLHYGGKLMTCIEALCEGDGEEPMAGMRSGMRGGYRSGMRGGMREEYDEYEGMPRTGMRGGRY